MAARQAWAQYPLDMGLRWTCSDTSVAKCQAHTCLRKGVAVSDDLSQRVDGAGADDLTRIEGIGPRRAERLNAASIRTYVGLASCSTEEIAAVLPDVGPAKIDTWRDKARELAPAEAPASQTRHAQAARPGADGERPAEIHTAPAGIQHVHTASSAVLSVEPNPLRAAEPFTLTMTIELAEPASLADRFAYSAVVVAMPLTGGPKQTVAKSDGLLAITSPTISIDATGLSPGAYRLDGAVSLHEPGTDRSMDLAGIAEGLLVQVLLG
jgi:predicted flap endonuclease-1-like 5' DNA nuclease